MLIGSILRFAEHFGHINRVIYAGESWQACVNDMRRTWNLLEPAHCWDEVADFIRVAWDEAGRNPKLANLPL
jgi:hypothetical protein